MKRPRFSEEQIIATLKNLKSVVSKADVCREHCVSSSTFHMWQAKFCDLRASDDRNLKALGAENAKLKKLLAKQILDTAMLKDVASRMW